MFIALFDKQFGFLLGNDKIIDVSSGSGHDVEPI